MAATIEASDPPDMPDTGSFAGDLEMVLSLLAASLQLTPRALLGAQIGAAIAERELAEQMLLPRAAAVMDKIVVLWDRAVARGEVDPALDGRAALQDLASAVHWHVLVYHREADEAYLRALSHRFRRGVAPPGDVP